MSEENVELVRSLNEAFANGDYSGSLEALDDAIEIVGPHDVTAGGAIWHGRDQVQGGFAGFLGAWDDYRYEVTRLIDCGEKVFVEARQQGRGKGSGVEVSELVYSVYTVREGRVVRMYMTRDRSEARSEAGLE
jgi:ketosteroid isomerase-like protein